MRLRARLVFTSLAGIFLASAVGCTALLGDFDVSPVSSSVPNDANTVDAPPVVDTDGGDGGSDAGPPKFTARTVSAGARHTCALTSTGEVYCWGDNGDGQLALPQATPGSSKPVKINLPVTNVASLVAGQYHTCVTTATGDAYCWGRNACGQVGGGTSSVEPIRAATKVANAASGPLIWNGIAPGLDHTCGIESSGATYCWGCNTQKQSGPNIVNATGTPTNAGADKLSPTFVSASDTYTCILGANSTQVRCWGTGNLGNGTLGGSTPDVAAPPATLGSNASLLATGKSHTCAVDANRNGTCWGDNAFGQLGNASLGASTSSPSSDAGVADGALTAIAAGGAFTCTVVAADNTVHCFGSNQSGELGRGGAVDTASHAAGQPVLEPGSTTAHIQATSIGAGRDHACAVLKGTSEVVCWGKSADGQLGDGTSGGAPKTTPVYVLPPQ